jgi:hypothetical protein
VAQLFSLGSIECLDMQETDITTKQQDKRQPRSFGYRWILPVLSSLLFFVLMVARDEIHSFWIRALLTGCVLAVLFGSILWMRKGV